MGDGVKGEVRGERVRLEKVVVGAVVCFVDPPKGDVLAAILSSCGDGKREQVW